MTKLASPRPSRLVLLVGADEDAFLGFAAVGVLQGEAPAVALVGREGLHAFELRLDFNRLDGHRVGSCRGCARWNAWPGGFQDGPAGPATERPNLRCTLAAIFPLTRLSASWLVIRLGIL